MKNKYKILSVILLSLILSGCSETSDNSSAPAESKAPDTVVSETAENVSDSEDEESVSQSLPVLSVVTNDGSTDFATKPVNGYVSSEIASWTPGYKIPPEPYYTECSVSLKDTNDKMLLDSAAAKIKVRGNWTTNYKKKPFRIDFEEKQSIADLNDGKSFKNWVLLAEYKDASMLRNKSALEIAGKILGEDGLYASDAEFAELYINDQYWGVYLIAELQQTGKNRINVTKAEKDYTGTDIGYFLEFDGYYFLEEPLQQFHVDYHENAGLKPFDGKEKKGALTRCLPAGTNDVKKDLGFTVKNNIYSQEQHDFIASFVNGVYNIMYEAAYNQKAFVFNEDYSAISETSDISPEEAVRRVVDIDSLADMYIISELTCDADLYWSSFFMTADFGAEGNKKLTFQAPWDFDSAMGNKDRCSSGSGFYAASLIPDVNGGEYFTVNPWLAVLIYEDWYQDVIRDKWTMHYDKGTFSDAVNMISEDTEKHSDAFERNNKKWGISTKDSSVNTELSEKALKCSTQSDAASVLKEWLENRVKFMNDFWHK